MEAGFTACHEALFEGAWLPAAQSCGGWADAVRRYLAGGVVSGVGIEPTTT